MTMEKRWVMRMDQSDKEHRERQTERDIQTDTQRQIKTNNNNKRQTLLTSSKF